MTHNGQRVTYNAGKDRIEFQGLCPHCAGDIDGCGQCWRGELTATDEHDELREAFTLNLRYVNFDTAYRLGKELATAARLKLEAQGVTGWEVGQ